MICPICNRELTQNESFCSQCGFEIHILPEADSDAVKAYERSRIETFKRIWEQGANERKTIHEYETRCDEFQQAVTESQESLDSARKVNNELTEQLSAAQYEISQLQAQIKNVKDTLCKEQNRKRVCEGYIIVRRSDDKERILEVLPVHQGLNIYGRMPQNRSNFHVYPILASCKGLEKEHFSIESTDEHCEINVLAGKIYLRNQYNCTKHGILSDQDDIYISDLVLTFIASY